MRGDSSSLVNKIILPITLDKILKCFIYSFLQPAAAKCGCYYQWLADNARSDDCTIFSAAVQQRIKRSNSVMF
jgi:hypothetical protein